MCCLAESAGYRLNVIPFRQCVGGTFAEGAHLNNEPLRRLHESLGVVNVNPMPRFWQSNQLIISKLKLNLFNIFLQDIIRLAASNEQRRAMLNALVFKTFSYLCDVVVN